MKIPGINFIHLLDFVLIIYAYALTIDTCNS